LAIDHLASHFDPNLLSSKAKEGLIVAVACQEQTQIRGIAFKATKTEAKSVCHRGHPPHDWSSVSHAFVRLRQEETMKGAVLQSLPSRKTQDAHHHHLSSMELKFELITQLTAPEW
jgi:hypothetical protein